MTEPVFLLGLAIVGSTVVMVTKMIAGAITGRRGSRSELADLRYQLDQQGAALEDAQAVISEQAARLEEFQDRLDFAERLLSQGRDRQELGPGTPGT
jgi:hypothetical protein